jgi:ABC-type bacteriocin/lantibiotic exporter with double-glycine peptidase domain
VPFVGQGPLLCGGAAAAMVERFWGARRVYAEDYAHLVRAEEGGIRTTDLALALRRHGYRARALRNDPTLVLRRLEEGVPAIVLLDGGAPTLHYVVLTAVDPSRIHYHDPKLGPDRSAPRAELLSRWRRSGYWALHAEPAGP